MRAVRRTLLALVTHHEIRVDGRVLKYTATVGRLPIKDAEGRIKATTKR
jgi:carboxypeptidase C (cathepsin A)